MTTGQSSQFNIPIVLIIFNRPQTAEAVLSRIAQVKPRRLLVIADGARPGVEGESERVAQARALIDRVDWECEISRNYAETNLGLRNRISSGLDWVFEQAEEAIILEDDCQPDLSFFPFCEELLNRYRHDPRVMQISGDNFFPEEYDRLRTSYHFTRFAHIWGWATWRRAWQLYDVEVKAWRDSAVRQRILSQFPTPLDRKYWEKKFNQVTDRIINTWDYQWVFTLFLHQGLSIAPRGNLISNLGFGSGATNTYDPNAPRAGQPVRSMAFPLIHPKQVTIDRRLERKTELLHAQSPTIPERIIRRIRKIAPGLLPK